MKKQSKLHKLWPTCIGEFYNPNHNEIKDDLLNYFSDYMKKNPNSRKAGENHNLYESEYNLHTLGNESFKKLLFFISNAILGISSEVNKSDIQNLEKPMFQVTINGSWFINYKKGGFVLPHTHSNCSWCCVYYLQLEEDANEDNGGTYFQKTLPARNINDFGSLYNKSATAKVKPEEGKLVVWPNFILHGSTPYLGKKNRIIVSANTTVSLVKDNKIIVSN
jgi:uncharacterized protein (TIGR02466 family)